MKIGIFGGTFDPVHNEHINICMSAYKEFKLDKVLVIPSGMPPHKLSNLTALKSDRYNMAKLAFEGIDKNIEILSYEIEKDRPCYTFLTMQYLKHEYPSDEFFLILGADSLIDFKKWRYPEKILSYSRLIVCGREGYNIYARLIEKIEREYKTSICRCSYTGAKLSSSSIKVFLEFGFDCKDVLNNKVLEYIKNNNLYHNYSFYIDKLNEMLSEKRYFHTVYTVIEALKLAKEVGCDEEKTFLAAALHDCTKKLTYEKLREYGFVLKTNVPEPIVHSISGSFMARVLFNVKDRDILNAIRFHTTGRPKMSNLEKVIYVADCIEQTRDYDGVDILRKKVYDNFNRGFLACMEATIQQLKLKENREEVSNMTLKAYEYYTENKNRMENL